MYNKDQRGLAGRHGGQPTGRRPMRPGGQAEGSGDSAMREDLDETGTGRTGQAAPRRPPARDAPAAIEVSHLTKVFGGRAAVSDVSFRVAGGEVFGFLGPN